MPGSLITSRPICRLSMPDTRSETMTDQKVLAVRIPVPVFDAK